MAFWDNVLAELEYKGMSNKALAEKVGIDASNIGRGIRFKSSPSADTALKIAKVLNVSVEYLVTGRSPNIKNEEENTDFQLFRKYSKTFEKLDALPEKTRSSIIQLIDCAYTDLNNI